MSATKEKIILGIDPGTNFMGYGLIIAKRDPELISLGAIDLSKLKTHEAKLRRIYERVSYLIKEYKPTSCALEAPFYGKNVQSMLKLGRAQGVAMAAAINMGLDIHEYAPKKVKQSVTGSGNASKEQVAAMLKQMFKYKKSPKYLDATDGLAVALCHHYQSGKPSLGGKSYSGWGDFLKDNPKKVIR